MTSICGNDMFCLLDLVTTGNEKLAQKTKLVNVENTENRIILEKEVPTLTGPTKMYLTVGQVTTITMSSNKTDSGFTFTSEFPLPSGATLDSSTGTFTWNVTDYITTPVNIKFGGYNGDNTTAVPLPVTVILCNCTNSTGMCTGNLLTPVQGLNFFLDECICHDMYTGQYCTEVRDYCQDSPCIEGAICVSIPPEQQLPDGPGYNCTACPVGYEEAIVANSYSKCDDIDECSDNSSNNCDQTCINTDGSYLCECFSGYKKVNTNQCEDVDECETGIAECKQICQNTNGTYHCLCYDGYTMLDNECVQNDTLKMACQSLSCQHGCRLENESAVCFCNRGYSVSEVNNTLCDDIDECNNNASSCGPKATCINEEGSYRCHCNTGYILNDDRRTCRPCSAFFWGDNCTNECSKCVNASSCNNEVGCTQCLPGWTGSFCDMDVNECELNPCGNHSNCVNTDGTFRCNCEDGYKVTTTGCEEIDDCLEEDGIRRTRYPCNNGTCVDALKGFTCDCLPGYIGQLCLQNIDDCVDNRCQHGSTCIDGINLYICKCREGFYGVNCDKYACTPTPIDDDNEDDDFLFPSSLTATNEKWSKDLMDPATDRYKELYTKTILKIQLIYSCMDNKTRDIYKGLEDVTFSEGSVVTNWLLRLNAPVDPDVLREAIQSRLYLFNDLNIDDISTSTIESTSSTNTVLYTTVGVIGAVALIVTVVLSVLFLRRSDRCKRRTYDSDMNFSEHPHSRFRWTSGIKSYGRFWQEAASLTPSALTEQTPSWPQYYTVSIPRPQLKEVPYPDFQPFTGHSFSTTYRDSLKIQRPPTGEYLWTVAKTNSERSTTN